MKRLIVRINKILRSRRSGKALRGLVSLFAAAVVFVTTYALLLPAITMEKSLMCGMEEHQHDDSCYELQLVCGQEESLAHRHTADCYAKVLICGKEQHIHSIACYHTNGVKSAAAGAVMADSADQEAWGKTALQPDAVDVEYAVDIVNAEDADEDESAEPAENAFSVTEGAEDANTADANSADTTDADTADADTAETADADTADANTADTADAETAETADPETADADTADTAEEAYADGGAEAGDADGSGSGVDGDGETAAEADPQEKTDGRLQAGIISNRGDRYEISVFYDNTAEIPDLAELRVTEIGEEDSRYGELLEEAETAFEAKYDAEMEAPLLLDIGIYQEEEEIEPAEGSSVVVQICQVNALPENDYDSAMPGSENDSAVSYHDHNENVSPLSGDVNDITPETFGSGLSAGEEGQDASSLLPDGVWINGICYDFFKDPAEADGENGGDPAGIPVIIHHEEEAATIVSGVTQTLGEDGDVLLTFETDSFSAYTITNLPSDAPSDTPPSSVIYVGDEIYLSGPETVGVEVSGGYTVEERGSNNYRVIKADHTGTIILQKDNRYWDYYQQRWVSDIKTVSIEVRDYPTQSWKPATIETVNNQESGIQLNLFDYDPDGVLNEAWNTSGYSSSNSIPYTYYYNYGINNGKILKFWTGCPGYDDPYNNSWSVGQYSASTGIVDDTLTGGYPTVTKGETTDNLSYLFSPTSDSYKTCYSGVDGLFRKTSDGYYVYDSYSNYAWFNGSNFEVYNTTFSYGGGSHKIGFFPFHPYNSVYESTLSTISGHQQLNHHFGMTMQVDFVLPDDGVDPVTGKDIVFSFNGDDDLWVYVDDGLQLDLGGIHQPVDGEINFTELVRKGSISTGEDNVHTLKVFYIERGGGDSNCKITFNTTRYKDVAFEKKGEEGDLLNGARFQLFEEDGTTPVQHVKRDAQGNLIVVNGVVQTEDWIVEAGKVDRKDGQVVFKGVPVGSYVIREIEPPEGYILDTSPLSGKVYISDSQVLVDVKDKNGTPISEMINHPYTTDVIVRKTDGYTFLPGAKFLLTAATEGGQYVALPAVPEFMVDSEEGYRITGLKAGKYQLRETEPPAGYIVVNAPIEFELKPDSDGESLVVEYVNTEYASLDGTTFTVVNTPGAALPATGGPGTGGIRLLGLVLTMIGAAGAGGIFIRTRRG